MKHKNKLLEEREKAHGAYYNTARISQLLKSVINNERVSHLLRVESAESLDMICLKIARIISHEGGEDVDDNWDDIAGYAELAKRANQS